MPPRALRCVAVVASVLAASAGCVATETPNEPDRAGGFFSALWVGKFETHAVHRDDSPMPSPPENETYEHWTIRVGDRDRVVFTIYPDEPGSYRNQTIAAHMDIPEGFVVVGGSPRAEGPLHEEPIRASVVVEAVQPGNWNIRGFGTLPGTAPDEGPGAVTYRVLPANATE